MCGIATECVCNTQDALTPNVCVTHRMPSIKHRRHVSPKLGRNERPLSKKLAEAVIQEREAHEHARQQMHSLDEAFKKLDAAFSDKTISVPRAPSTTPGGVLGGGDRSAATLQAGLISVENTFC